MINFNVIPTSQRQEKYGTATINNSISIEHSIKHTISDERERNTSSRTIALLVTKTRLAYSYSEVISEILT